MSYKPWTREDLDYLDRLLTSQKMGRRAIAERMGRTETGVNAKIAELRGGRENRLDVGSGVRFTAGFDRPNPRSNDDFKHLTLIARANNGMGFPACVIPAKYRVVA